MDNAQIRKRISDRLDEMGVRRDRYAVVAAWTGEDRRQVRKWLTGETDQFPAVFAAKLARPLKRPVGWILGAPDVEDPRTGRSDDSPAPADVRALAFDQMADVVRAVIGPADEGDPDWYDLDRIRARLRRLREGGGGNGGL